MSQMFSMSRMMDGASCRYLWLAKQASLDSEISYGETQLAKLIGVPVRVHKTYEGPFTIIGVGPYFFIISSKLLYNVFMSQKYNVVLLKKEEVAEDTMVFTIQKPVDFIYKAGQTIDLIIPSSEGNDLSHTFSIITEPNQDHLAVVTRMRDSEYKNTLKGLEVGANVEIEGPYGSFALHQAVEKTAVFLVGGIGIAPFMGMLRDAIERKLTHKFYLFYSNRSLQTTAFFEELNKFADSKDINFVFVPTMTDEEIEGDWEGEKGYVTWEMVEKHVTGSEEVVYYMAGPQGMVSAMRTMLNENNISEDSIRFEEFSGY